MSRHTPGPWKWFQGDGPSDMPVLLGRHQNGTYCSLVCDFGSCKSYYPTEGFPPSRADSALIAAAPSLYEICDLIVTRHDNGAGPNDYLASQLRPFVQAVRDAGSEHHPAPIPIKVPR